MISRLSSFIVLFTLQLLLAACEEGASPQLRPAGSTPIFDIQGNGRSSPMEDSEVTVVGVVTGDFQDGDDDEFSNLGGFYVQDESGDNDPDTSDGIFVFDRTADSINVEIGHVVTIEGTVTERFAETQITASTVRVSGRASIEPVNIAFPVDVINNSDDQPIADLERFEGMLVRLADGLFVSDVFLLDRFGEITLSAGDRLRQFTNSSSPGVESYAAHVRNNAGVSLILDDGRARRNVMPIRFMQSTAPLAGQRASDIVGNIRFSRSSGASGVEAYRLEPTREPTFSGARAVSPRPRVGGSVTVASFNVLNFFTTIDDDGAECGPSGDGGCRGADSDAEFGRQREKTVNTLLALDADVVGLVELENNGREAVQSLADGMNDKSDGSPWAFVDTGTIGDDAIAVGLIYRSSAVRPINAHRILTAAVDNRFNDKKNRPALAQSFESLDDGGKFTVAVNHLKSKGSPCDDVNDPNLNDGQGNCNRTRARAAAALGDWLSDDPTGGNDPDVLIIGDLNAYLQEDPLTALKEAGFVNLLESESEGEAYSFVFGGRAGALDHALVSPSLLEKVTGVAEWHINADAPPVFDYNLEFDRDPTIFDADSPIRTSDHDPVIVGFDP